MYFDPYDRGEHVVSAEELEAWTSPSHPSVQYMGYSVTFIDPSVDSKRPPLTLETILDQRIANIRTTIRNIGGFKVTAPPFLQGISILSQTRLGRHEQLRLQQEERQTGE